MDPPASPPADGRCSCACCCSSSPSRPSMKRKLDIVACDDVARVKVETEVSALREALAGHQQSVQELSADLEEERNASATAASETMSMIVRLQREKAEALMESRQFKRFAEEKMAHDQNEVAALEDLLFRREQALQSLSYELQAYRHRLLSYGMEPPPEPETPDYAAAGGRFDLPAFIYPPLRCITAHGDIDPDAADDEKYAFGDTPHFREDIEGLEHQIHQLEMSTQIGSGHVMEKGLLAGQSPRRPTHFRTSSSDSYGSDLGHGFKEDEFPVTVDRPSDEGGADETNDRVYTIDTVHHVAVPATCEEECISIRGEPAGMDAAGSRREAEVGDIKKLYSRLQALEADRESMRQSLITMRTEKAQLVLLREIAQELCKEVKPEREVVKKPSVVRSFWIVEPIKWIVSFLFWRRKASQCKYVNFFRLYVMISSTHRTNITAVTVLLYVRYTFGLSKNNAGLLLLLDKSPIMNQWRCLRRTRG